MTATVHPKLRREGHRVNATLARYLQAFRTPKGIFATCLIAVLAGASFLAPVIFSAGYDQQTSDALSTISGEHSFGTDELGRDIFIRSIYGLRTDLSLVFIGGPVSMALGTLLGLIGAISPRLGTAVQRGLDIILGFPGMVLGICIVIVLGAGWTALLVAIIIYGLPGFGRLARSTLLAQQQREYVIAARTVGVGRWRTMARHILPNALDPILVQGAVFVVSSIFLEAGLSIVGLGIQPPQPSLGALLNVGMRYVTQSPTYILGPTLILLVLAFAFSLLADALNEAVNRK